MNINEPWEASIDWAPDFPRGSHVFDADGNEIATHVDGFQATLIAAAPDLLAALTNLADLLITIGYGNTREGQQAKAAIKKAKGE